MSLKPRRPCKQPGCPHLASDMRTGYCDEHLKQSQRQLDASRPNANARGYDYRWQVRSRIFLNNNPLCYYCQHKDPPVIRAATLVDHFIPPKGNRALFWDESLWRASCDECHAIKTAKEDGAFGNPLKRRG